MGTTRPAWWRPRTLELGALALGTLFGLGLLVAGWWLDEESPAVGRLALAETVGRIADEVEREWERWRDHPEQVVVDGFRWAATARVEPEPEPAAGAGSEAAPAFDALLSQARELDRRDGDPVLALEAVLAALEQPVDAGRRARGRLRAIQLAARAARPEVGREQWAACLAEQSGAEQEGGTSTLLLSALAAAPLASPAERLATRERLVGLWVAGGLTLPPGPVSWVRDAEGRLQPESAVMIDVLAERVQGLVDEAPDARLEQDKAARMAAALSQHFGALPDAPAQGRIGVAVRGEDALVYRRLDDGGGAGSFWRFDELCALLQADLGTTGLVPTGFRVLVGALQDVGRAEPDGTGVKQASPLLAGLAYAIHHDDPAAFVASEARRMEPLRLGLLGMGALAILAGLVSFEALRRQRRLHALKARFIANVSHELRTPVTAILLNAESLQEGRAQSSERRERYHGMIRKEALRLQRLVEDVLDFSRLERGEGARLHRRDVDLPAWVDDLIADCRERAVGAGLDFEESRCLELESAHIDVESLRRAVTNLVDNAIHHAGSPTVAVFVVASSEQLTLQVVDGGRGIPRAQHEAIFQPFHQVADGSEPVAGTGLGLAIVREIAAAHGGSVSCATGPGERGCVFTLSVPLARVPGEQSALERSPTTSDPRRSP